MPSYDYIPPTDEGFRTWAEQFKTKIQANPAMYMLTQADADSIATVVDAYIAALALASGDDTRTKATVAAKDDTRVTAETLCRQYAIDIKFNYGISDEDKIAVGVRPVNTNREPIDPPATNPLLSILGNTPGAQTLRFSDSLTPDSPAKPFGAVGLQLYLAVNDVEAAPLSDCQFQGMHTRNPIGVEFSETDDGKMATYYARWVNAKGETGPWSLPTSMRIAA